MPVSGIPAKDVGLVGRFAHEASTTAPLADAVKAAIERTPSRR